MSGGQQVLAYQKERIQVLCSEQGRQIEQLKKLVRSFDRRKNKVGAMGVSWAPAIAPGALVSAQEGGQFVKRLVTCGCDNLIKIWSEQNGQWVCESSLKGHENWVRDAAWAPDLGLPRSTIASAGQDGKVFVWKEESPGNWKQQLLNDFGGAVWRLSWSLMGNVLAVSDSNNQVTVWKESLLGEWQQL
eukprot:TRINITY_DN1540_c0_g1_i2.p1 TRINITY_DN1540_c0_g1~~TRINITY_DN1540_c0_g1_i2.p1  ORF type:complete len:188 (+),score=27.14 TRINITY_DN1540_c0_g1_i2:117-680(+)